MEYIPVVTSGGEPREFLAIVNDIVKVVSSRGVRWFLWIDDIGVDVTDFVDRDKVLRLGESVLDLSKLFDESPWLFAKTVESVDEYVSVVKDLCKEVEGKKVAQAFSGGKDSSVALAALNKLRNYVDFELDVVYVHMPFIEPEKNVSEAIRIARILGSELVVLEPPRKEVLRELRRFGLPKRGCRLCTYLKVAPLRFRSKAMGIDFQAYGDRMWEAGKRLERLFFRFFLDKRLVSKHLGFTVIAPLTIVDVIELCRSMNAVHYMYLRGAHRVSCIYCPQKPIFELVASGIDVEDPGLIDEIIKAEWERKYSRVGIDLESFKRFHLWRFTPSAAKNLLKAKEFCEKLVDKGRNVIKSSEILDAIRSPWIYGIKAPRVSISRVLRVFEDIARKIIEHRKSFRESALTERQIP